MKNFILRAPLFILTYLSLLGIFIATQFIPQLQEFFPEFSQIVSNVKVVFVGSPTEYYDSYEATNTVTDNTAEMVSIEEPINPVPNIVVLPEETTDMSDEDAILLSQIYQTNFNLEHLVSVKRSEIQGSGRGGFYSFGKVDKNYFNNVLFIGDSRTVGLDLYSNLDNADFAADVGMTIYDVFDRRVNFNGGRTNVGSILQAKKYGKIYIMLGINECGGNTDAWIDSYSTVLEQIRAYQPSAIIVVQSIMKVGAGKSSSSRTINNPNIQERNERLSELANGWNIYYLDINPAVCDGNGNLISEYTFDQVHLYAKYYYLWEDYLLEHGLK